MKESLPVVLLALSAIGLTLASTHSQNGSEDAPTAIIEGLVRDIACPIQNKDATATQLSIKCLLACARRGSPLVILSPGGELYVPISDQMPDVDQRPKLMPFLGKYVRASGVVYERKGTRTIMIRKIEELKDVHLTIEGQ
jgi:hypothetical protein